MSQPNTYAPWWAALFDRWLAQPPLEPSQSLRAGRQAYEAGDYQACIDFINRAFDLETPPFSDQAFSKATAFLYRGYAYRELGYYSRAVADLERVLRLKPSIARFYLELADLHLHFERSAEALAVLNEGMNKLDAKQAADLYLLRGRIAGREGNFQQAMDDFNIAVYYQSRQAEPYYRRGLLFARLNNLKRAFQDFRQAIRIAPDEVTAYYHYGRVLFRNDRFYEAFEQLAEAVYLAPGLPEPASLLGRCLVQLGAYAEALPVLEKAVSLGADDQWTARAYDRVQQVLGIEEQDDGSALITARASSVPESDSEDQDSINLAKIYERTEVDQQPMFSSDDDEEEDDLERRWAAEEDLRTYIYEKLDYPDEARDTGVSGVVHLEFIIERNGRITHLRAKNNIGYGCAEAALNVIRRMIAGERPWIPGKINGTAVRTRYRLPVRFSPAKAILDSLE